MEKQRIFISFPTPYHLPQLDQPFRNGIKKYKLGCSVCEILRFSKLLFNHRELEKTFNMQKEQFCSSFPTPHYLPHSDKWFKNTIENTIYVFCMKKKWFSKLLLNRLHFAKTFTWVMILVSIDSERYIASPIWAMLAEVQPSSGRSSGRTTQAVKLQKTQFHHDPRAKSASERDFYLKPLFSC